MTYFCPALDPPLGGSGRKTTTLVRDLEYFIHTKFHQNPSSGSGEEVENVNSLTDDRRTTDGRTTDYGQRVITIGHWSLWLLCPKKVISLHLHIIISIWYRILNYFPNRQTDPIKGRGVWWLIRSQGSHQIQSHSVGNFNCLRYIVNFTNPSQTSTFPEFSLLSCWV